MKTSMQRRQFLQTAGAAAMSGAGIAVSKEAATNPAPSPSAGAPRLFSGCCAYSYRKYLAGGKMTMEDFIVKGVEIGLDGMDMTVYWLKSTEAAYLTGLRHFAFKNGIPFSGAQHGGGRQGEAREGTG